MKKALSLILALIMILTCAFAFSACSGKDADDDDKRSKKEKHPMGDMIAGSYELVEISGYIQTGEGTIPLTSDLYEYYTLVLDKYGDAKVKTKYTANGLALEQDATWDYEDGYVKLKTTTNGYSVIEEMFWSDGVIYYDTTQTAQNMTISMNLVLERK